MIIQYLSEGFALGLSLSVTCIGTCGPIYSSYLLQRKSDVLQSIVIVLKLSGARFFAYALFGLFAGFIGREIGDFNRSWFTTIAYALCSVLLIISAFQTHQSEKGCAMARWRRFIDSPVLLGLVTGLNFCPSFLIAVTRAVDVSGPVSGALVFTAFFFGSNLPLFFFAIFGVMGNMKMFRQVGIVSAVVVGLFFLYKSVNTGITLIKNEKQFNADMADNTIINVMDSTDAFILSDDTTRYSTLKSVLIKNRKGPVVTINTKDKLPDSGYIFVDHLWGDGTKAAFDSLKKAGLFVIVLSEPQDSGVYDETYAKTLAGFLAHYHFKLDKEHGSIFYMNHFKRLQGRKQGEK